jgi:hypothetical protein
MHSDNGPYKADANNIGVVLPLLMQPMQKMHSHVMSHRKQRISRKGTVISRFTKLMKEIAPCHHAENS